jgi:hypothetical protein
MDLIAVILLALSSHAGGEARADLVGKKVLQPILRAPPALRELLGQRDHGEPARIAIG